MSFSLKHRILLRDIDGAGLAQWAGFRTPNPRVPGSIPGRVGVIFSLFWGCLGMCLGVLLEGFRMVRARKKISKIGIGKMLKIGCCKICLGLFLGWKIR